MSELIDRRTDRLIQLGNGDDMTVRRTRLRLVIAAVIIGVVTLSACGGKSAPPTAQSGTGSGSGGGGPSPSPSQSLTVDTPAAAGQLNTVTWNEWEGEPTTIDPFHSADYTPNTINSNMCENLIALKPDFTFGPNLATSWRYATPTSLVLELRKGVTFWDGSPMTADDVVFSLQENLKDKTSFYNYLFNHVASVAKTGAYQVTIKLSQPDYLLVNELADYAGVVVEKKFWQAHAKNVGSPSVGVMCTGPFKFASWSKGDNITLTRYDGYWDKSRMPKVKTLIFKFLTDEASITSALLSGQIDGAYDPPLSGLTKLASAKNVGRLYNGPHLSDMTWTYSNPKGAMANLKLREALQRAVDWKGLASTVLQGTGEPIRALLPPTVFTYGKDVLQAAYDKLPAPVSADIAGAKKLVAAAGADAKKKIVMALPAAFTAQQYCNAVAAAARQIGLNLQLKVVPVDEYTNYLYDPKTRAGVDMLWTDFWPNTPDPLDYLGIAAKNGGSFNQYGYTKIDSVYSKAQATKDPDARAKLIAQMMATTTADLLPMVPGISHTSRLWMNNRITGAPASFDYVYYPWAATLGAAK